MQDTPRSSRLQIALFGRRNAGKSSLINAITNQQIALVSDVPGTTTDPVYKSMELLPFGPVVLIDTPGMDDDGELGNKRVDMAKKVLRKADLAMLVVDASSGIGKWEHSIANAIKQQGIPALLVINKIDLAVCQAGDGLGMPTVEVSAKEGQGIDNLKTRLVELAPADFWDDRPIVGDLLNPGEQVLMIVPIDKAAPKGRLILPQVQLLRDILDHGGSAVVARETEAAGALANMQSKPRLVVTDSQVFSQAAVITPPDIWLTSFSILFARHKGNLPTLVAGTDAVAALRPGDRVLIAEACTHRRQHEDIGTVKIPRWLNERVGGELAYEWSSGTGYPDNLQDFKLVVHCGGCMLNRREMLSRLADAQRAGVPIVNYGVLISYLQGILPRALQPFQELNGK